MAKLEALERELRVVTTARLTGDEHKKNFIEIASRGRDEEIARQRGRGAAIPTVETTVDGVRGAALTSVKIGGRIRFDFRYWREIAEFALKTLMDLSPVESGDYRSGHFIMANGQKVEASAIPPDVVALIITNDMPYSRKIQIGAMRMSVPPGVYDRARVAINAKYGNVFRTDVIFVDLAGAYELKKKSGRVRYPALSIRGRFAA
jgi:hypothetical protein